ncbi:MAG: hypothetical protein AB7L36_00705 [Sphingomonadaceae bacterium]
MTRRADPLNWLPLDDAARSGRSVLLRGAEGQMALARWNGEGFTYPATWQQPIGFTPVAYYVPDPAHA